MKTNYDKIKDYLSQKGYDGHALETGARKAAIQVEAIQAGLDPVQSKLIPAAPHEGRVEHMNATEFANRLVNQLEEKAEFHRANSNDPHGVGTAVYTALSEVVMAIKDAQEMDKIKTPIA